MKTERLNPTTYRCTAHYRGRTFTAEAATRAGAFTATVAAIAHSHHSLGTA